MPCRCDGAYTKEEYENERIRMKRVRQLADIATRAACDMRTCLRKHKLLHELTEETQAWVKQHDKEDAKRIAAEEAEGLRQQVKINALKKLTLEERRVLGL